MNKSLRFGGGTEGVTGQVKLVLNTHRIDKNTHACRDKKHGTERLCFVNAADERLLL